MLMNKINLQELLKFLQCPISGGKLEYSQEKNMLFSPLAKVFFPIINGVPILLVEEALNINPKEKDANAETI